MKYEQIKITFDKIKSNFSKIKYKIANIIVYGFAIIGIIMTFGYTAMKLGWTQTAGVVDAQHDYFQDGIKNNTDDAWSKSEEWLILKQAILKDTEVINKVSEETGVPSRMIVAPLVVEQLRLFNSEREIFKKIFAPLRILGNQSQFSWGVMGIKQETARKIEWNENKINTENQLTFKTSDHNKERFERLTNEKDRYYSYLYGALYIKQFEKQWLEAGFPIDDKPAVVATLYNIGFEHSKPHENPSSGGAEIEVGDRTYSFGELAGKFYESKELADIFKR